jgi:hypothetical protein
MTNHLDALKGAIVQSCQLDAGSVILGFDSRRLVVHNRWEVRGADGGKVDESVLIGAVVTNLVASDTVLRVEFGPIVLNVDFSASAWAGPEAAVFYVDGRPVVAWT